MSRRWAALGLALALTGCVAGPPGPYGYDVGPGYYGTDVGYGDFGPGFIGPYRDFNHPYFHDGGFHAWHGPGGGGHIPSIPGGFRGAAPGGFRGGGFHGGGFHGGGFGGGFHGGGGGHGR